MTWDCDQENDQRLRPEKWPELVTRKMLGNDLKLRPEKWPEIMTRKMTWKGDLEHDQKLRPEKRPEIMTWTMTWNLKNDLGLRPGKWPTIATWRMTCLSCWPVVQPDAYSIYMCARTCYFVMFCPQHVFMSKADALNMSLCHMITRGHGSNCDQPRAVIGNYDLKLDLGLWPGKWPTSATRKMIGTCDLKNYLENDLKLNPKNYLKFKKAFEGVLDISESIEGSLMVLF